MHWTWTWLQHASARTVHFGEVEPPEDGMLSGLYKVFFEYDLPVWWILYHASVCRYYTQNQVSTCEMHVCGNLYEAYPDEFGNFSQLPFQVQTRFPHHFSKSMGVFCWYPTAKQILYLVTRKPLKYVIFSTDHEVMYVLKGRKSVMGTPPSSLLTSSSMLYAFLK